VTGAIPKGTHEGGLDRTLGLWQVTASGVGIIVGAGIYVLIGAATSIAGPRVWMAFVLAALLSALTGLSYAELASMYPKAGAEFEYATHVYPRWLAFLVGWVMFVGLTVAAAAVSLGFGRYLGHFLGVSPRVGAFVLLAFVGVVAWSGIRRSAALTVALSLVQVGGLLFVITIGAPHLGQVDLLSGAGGDGSIIGAAALVFFAFIGFDEVITLAEETRDPTRTVPRALLLALGISTLLYVGVAIAGVSVIGAEALGSAERPLAAVIDHALGGRGADVVAAVALLATTNTTLLCLTASSRLQYGMATAGALPTVFADVGPVSRAPRAAIAFALVGAAAFVVIGDLSIIASVTDFAVYLVFIAVNIAVILLRLRQPEVPRPFRSPWSIGRVPVLPVPGLMAVLVMLPALRWEASAMGLGLCALGVVVDQTIRWTGTRSRS
jgi:APA family basic amino acid/polyamine antiporter